MNDRVKQIPEDEIHQRRLKGWPCLWRSLLLRVALGQRTFDYMLRSIRNDPRTPGARQIDIVVRQDAVERRIEADWVKTIARWTYHLETPCLGRKPWNLNRLWCWLDDHGGIACELPGPLCNANRPYCKRCGARVKLIS